MSKILVIEDDPINAQVLEDYLEAQGYEVLVARDGPDGLEQFNAERPDMAIVDVHLPRLNGFEIVNKVRTTAWGAEIPVLFMSAVYTNQERGESYTTDNLGAQGYLVKPFELHDLLLRVRSLLGAAA